MLALLAVARIVCLSCRESALPPSAVRQEQRLADRLRQDVEALCARPRYGDETTRRQAVEYISERLRRAGWQVRLHRFSVPPAPEDVAEGATAGQGWRNPHYHEPTDTAETLDYPRLARVTLNLSRFLRALISH